MWTHLHDRPLEPQPRQLIQLLDSEGQPDTRWTKVRAVISEDRAEEIWEVIDSQNRTRFITAAAPREWLEVEAP